MSKKKQRPDFVGGRVETIDYQLMNAIVDTLDDLVSSYPLADEDLCKCGHPRALHGPEYCRAYFFPEAHRGGPEEGDPQPCSCPRWTPPDESIP